jgi:hypothetical protein
MPFAGYEGRVRKMHGFLLPPQRVTLDARRGDYKSLVASGLSPIRLDKPAYKNR